MFLGKRGEARAVMGKERLVGGDHVLAGLECGFDRFLGRAALASDQLDESVDRRVAGKRDRILDKAETRNICRAPLFPVAGRHCDHLDGPAGAVGKRAAAGLQQLQDPASHRAEPG